ncbi:MAG: hypothetical protein IJG38_12010 [Thermoguttaceae bacterium]|nr:hypothetical protein [Thermoguttaceae bacterium]
MKRLPKREVVEYEKLTLEIPAEIKRNARYKAATEGRNITDIIMEALLNYLREYETRDKLKKLEARIAALEEKTKNL